MATVQAGSPVSSFAQRARRRRVEQALRSLQADGWQERLQPLATHLAAQRLVRACGYPSAPLRQLDLTLLREALSALLRDDWDAGSLITQLILEGQEPAVVAAQRGVSRPLLVEQLRDAVRALAGRYEHVAQAGLTQWPALGGRSKRG